MKKCTNENYLISLKNMDIDGQIVFYFITIFYVLISIILIFFWLISKENDNQYYDYILGGGNILLGILIFIVGSYLMKDYITKKDIQEFYNHKKTFYNSAQSINDISTPYIDYTRMIENEINYPKYQSIPENSEKLTTIKEEDEDDYSEIYINDSFEHEQNLNNHNFSTFGKDANYQTIKEKDLNIQNYQIIKEEEEEDSNIQKNQSFEQDGYWKNTPFSTFGKDLDNFKREYTR